MKTTESFKCIRCSRWAVFGLRTCIIHTEQKTILLLHKQDFPENMLVVEARDIMDELLKNQSLDGPRDTIPLS